MKPKTYYAVTAVIFAAIFVLHSTRFASAWSVNVGDFSIPVWVSGILGIIAGVLAIVGFILTKKS